MRPDTVARSILHVVDLPPDTTVHDLTIKPVPHQPVEVNHLPEPALVELQHSSAPRIGGGGVETREPDTSWDLIVPCSGGHGAESGKPGVPMTVDRRHADAALRPGNGL
jgi:hypothetical protein